MREAEEWSRRTDLFEWLWCTEQGTSQVSHPSPGGHDHEDQGENEEEANAERPGQGVAKGNQRCLEQSMKELDMVSVCVYLWSLSGQLIN